MAKTFIHLTREAIPEPLPVPVPEKLDLVGWEILERTMGGELPVEIGAVMGMDVVRVEQLIGSEAFTSSRSRLEAGMARRIQRGAFGVAAIAKQESTSAMRRIVTLGKTAGNEETKRKANLDVLAHAGIIPEKRVAVVSPDRMIDQMTADECERFARLGVMPERLRDTLAPWVRGQTMLPGPAVREAIDAEADEVDETEEPG